MLNRIATFVVITLVASLVWLFAEAESLGEASLSEVSVRFQSDNRDRLVKTAPDWRSRVSVEIRGSRQAIEEARLALVDGVRLTPGASGVPDGSGTVDLLAALNNVPEILETGVEVTSVTPIRTEITVLDLVTVEASIQPDLAGVRVAGSVDVTPPTAQIRMPEPLRAELGDAFEITCVPDAEAIDSLPESGPVTLTGRLVLPPALRGKEGVSILSPSRESATLEFAVFSTITTESINIVPVQLSMPSIEFNDWRVTLSAENAAVSAEITGPRSVVEEIADESTGRRLVGLLYLRSDELNLGITSKAISFGLLSPDGTLGPLPPSVSVQSPADDVRFTIERIPEGASPGGE